MYNRYGYDIEINWLSTDEVTIKIPKSHFIRASQTPEGALTFVDFEGGPFLEVGSTQEIAGKDFTIGAIERAEGGGFKLTRKQS